jgi:hypothetical protein
MEPPLRLFHTVFFPTPRTVTATASISEASIGSEGDFAGTVGALIWKVGIVRPDGRGTDAVDLSQSFAHNHRTFDRCIFVTFALSLRRATGVGLYMVQVHG